MSAVNAFPFCCCCCWSIPMWSQADKTTTLVAHSQPEQWACTARLGRCLAFRQPSAQHPKKHKKSCQNQKKKKTERLSYHNNLANHQTQNRCRADLHVFDRAEQTVNKATYVRRVQAVFHGKLSKCRIRKRLWDERQGNSETCRLVFFLFLVV